MPIKLIAQYLGTDEKIVREHLSETLEKLVDDLSGRCRLNLLAFKRA